MSFADALKRLEGAILNRQPGEQAETCRIRRQDLRELLHHFRRLDNEARQNLAPLAQAAGIQTPPLPVKSSAGVQCISFNGTIIIAHPDFPPHMWDAEAKKMRRIGLEAARSVEL